MAKRGEDIAVRLAALAAMPAAELRAEWTKLYETPPPTISTDLLLRALAWHAQAQVHGGLKADARRRLAHAVRQLARGGDMVMPDTSLRSGTRLLREWHGRTHDVVVLEDGYHYAGRRYASLSAIARQITGTRWSGPRFFGLADRKAAA